MKQPGQGDLRRCDPFLRGHCHDAVDNRVIGVLIIEAVSEVIALGTGGGMIFALLAAAGQEAARQRAPRDNANSLDLAEGIHLALFLAVDEVIVVLHGDKTGPAMFVGQIEALGELPGVHARRANVACLARLDHIV